MQRTTNHITSCLQSLLEEHGKMKEAREKREAEKREKEEKRLAELRALRESEGKKPGFQRLRQMQYDDLRKKLVSSGGKLGKGEVRQQAITVTLQIVQACTPFDNCLVVFGR